MDNYGLQYPVRCNSPRDLRRIQPKIYDMLFKNVNVHFMYDNHPQKNCSNLFNEALSGGNPERKIILISQDHPDMDTEVNALVTIFIREFEHLGRGVAVGNRCCPYCNSE